MQLPLTVSCFNKIQTSKVNNFLVVFDEILLVCLIQPNETFLSKIQIGFTFLVPADPGSPEKRAVKRVCVCLCCTTFLLIGECVPLLC